jgi:isoleucyl-tRNA synthetase
LTPELIRGGYAREVVNRIQRGRKDSGFAVTDRVTVIYYAEGDLAQAIEEHQDYIMRETLCLDLQKAWVAQANIAEIDGCEMSYEMKQVSSI